MPTAAIPDADAALERLATCEAPLLVGVRHHSPALSAAMPTLLDRFAPERILLELPPDFAAWLDWLGHPELTAPVALAGCGDQLAFYPFADFSPELAAVRWAVANDVPVIPFDLPLGAREHGGDPLTVDGSVGPLLEAMRRRAGASDAHGAMWDRLVEARATGADAEALRRAGLLVGWSMRLAEAWDDGIAAANLRRETAMRAALDGPRAAAVVGAFHAAALLPEPLLWEPREPGAATTDIKTSLVPYDFELLDSRSGYPAGIRDPYWRQRMWEAAHDGTPAEHVLAHCVVAICAELRDEGHVAGVPDAREAVRLAEDLGRLRGLPAAGRQELLEAVQTALARGELLGRGRVLARAMQRVLVGRRRGELAPDTPRSGLAPHVEALLAELKLPGPEASNDEPLRKRLDPIRSPLDRRRHVALRRLGTCGIPYATEEAGEAAGGTETLTRIWTIRWTPATGAMLELAGVRGVTLEQAAAGALRGRRDELERHDALTPLHQLRLLDEAAECGLRAFAEEQLAALTGTFLAQADLPELLEAHAITGRIARGHVPGLADDPPQSDEARARLIAAAVRAVDGLAGSERLEDAHAILELVRVFEGGEQTTTADASAKDGRLVWSLEQLARDGSPLMQGASGAALVLLGARDPEQLGTTIGSWVDDDDRKRLTDRLRGALLVAAPLMEADPGFAAELLGRVEGLPDPQFLRRLPALRGGFDVLSPAARGRLLDALGERLDDDEAGGALDLTLEDDPDQLARCAAADEAGRAAAAPFLDDAPAELDVPDDDTPEPLTAPRRIGPGGSIGARDRWRLILGRQRDKLTPQAARMARALDELYGAGRGEGSRGGPGGPDGGAGKEDPFPNVREWADELEALFGEQVREEVLGQAAAGGRGAAILELEPESVTPSVELLEQVLALKGGLPEKHLARLRKLVARIVDELVKQLATRVQPALTGLATPRPTRRPGGRLDLRRTVRANLRTLRERDDGAPQLVPERLVFNSRAKRSMDWRVILVVDVSGSMEPSVIYSAMMAAILSGMPAVTVDFLAFSTEVIDLSERVEDPLGLLLEVQVGGGTHIARALRAARERIEVPARTMILVVSDFDEGWPVANLLAEVRALVESGARPLGLAALDDRGKPRYNRAVAGQIVSAGMPVAALTPLELARWIGEQLR